MSDPVLNKTNVFLDSSFVLATIKRDVKPEAIARVLGIPLNEVEMFSSECVKTFLMKSMKGSSRESHRDKYADAIKKVKALGGHAGCHGHTKGSYREIDCIKALLKADTGKWYIGTCNPNHRAAVQKVPNVGLLRIEGNAVVRG